MSTRKNGRTDVTRERIVLVEDDLVTISKLAFTDPLVAGYLTSVPAEQRCAELMRAIGVGVHGLSTTTMRATIEEMQQQVQRIIATATAAASVGVNIPVRIPPRIMIGINRGRSAFWVAKSICFRLLRALFG